MTRRPYSYMDYEQSISRMNRRPQPKPSRLPFFLFLGAGLAVAGIGFYVLSKMI